MVNGRDDDLVLGFDAVRVGGERQHTGVFGDGEERKVAIGGGLERDSGELNAGVGGDREVGVGREEMEGRDDKIAVRRVHEESGACGVVAGDGDEGVKLFVGERRGRCAGGRGTGRDGGIGLDEERGIDAECGIGRNGRSEFHDLKMPRYGRFWRGFWRGRNWSRRRRRRAIGG